MIDAERQIEAFQKKLLANTQQATELLKRAGAPDTKIEEMWERIYEAREKAFLAKDDKSTQDYTDFLKFQDEAAKYVPKYKMKFDISKEDYNKIAEAAINENSRMQNIIDRLQDNIASLGNLAQKAQEIGAKSVTAFLNEWANGLNNLGNMLQNALGGVEIPQIPNAEGIIAYAQKQNAPQIPQQSRDDIKGYVSGGGRTVNVGGIVVNMPIENVNKEVDVDKYKSAVVNEIMTTMKQYVDNDDAAYAT
jgi:hypothetical protein